MTLTPSSNDKASETTAAATSPIECPMTAPGLTPYEASVAASETCIANSVGWTRSMPVTVSGAEIASVTEKPDSAWINGSRRAMVSANTGSLPSNSAPMPAHCDP
ncbi:Uncharacterised protein [Mycobacteroides abscessus subsp. abscessus]|nr:Uncharacterised protein [Mycobacteroides abscessus subsp. abscessus]SKT06956.1 Uncharacterised protein [Mycobacteroides abscessus subsp. abscessus]SKU60870.1 Uncharacterised protein [Mycobacteroides abscessus subsp. abscessus]